MSGKTLKIKSKSTSILALCAAFALAGCDENGEFQMPQFGSGGDGEPSANAGPVPPVELIERDVEAPDVFSVTENGLWDGRPSLGGVWVAHPDVKDPERVIIRNTSNGEFVIGALFRRERENPGPSLQVSSDAAEALGLLAGSPTVLNVIALRTEKGPAEPTEAATTEILGPPPAVEATSLDETTTVASAQVELATPTAPVATPDPTPAATPEPDNVLSAAAIAIAAAEAAEATATNDVVAAAPTPAPAPVPAPAPAPVSTLEKPFIQIGIFSVETNATGTADRLRADGLLATVLQQESRGKTFWRVIVGPAPNAADRAAVLAKAKAIGFTDAYFVTN